MIGRLSLGLSACLAAMFTLFAVSAQAADDELVQLVLTLLADNDKDVRALAFEQVRSDAKGAAATTRFAEQLPKLTPDGQIGLLSALADRGDAAARPAVVEVLAKSQDDQVRIAAIKALGPLGNATDTSQLVALLSSRSAAERAAARRSLIDLRGKDVAVAITAKMKGADAPVRIALIETLTERRALDAVPDLLSAVVDDEPTVRAAAMKALGQLAGPVHIPGMVQGVLKAEHGRERETAEKCVMFVCSRIENASSRADSVLAAMEKLETSDRLTMLSTLGRIGGPQALEAIEAAVADADANVHEMGLRAMCNWPDASIAPRLMELAKTDEHPSHQIAALRSLIRVAPLSDERTDAQRLQLLHDAMTMSTRDTERNLVLDRARAIRTLEALHFIVAYIDQPAFSKQACLSVVELAHHRTLREPHKAEFHKVLDKVIATSKDATIIDRANRYKKDQTWVRPRK